MSKTFTDGPPRHAPALVRHTLKGETMGTRYSVVFYGPKDFPTELLARSSFDAVDRVDRQMSTWKADSDLNRLNVAPVGEWVTLPAELMTVLAEALRVGRLSNGAFDIGVGALVNAWGFGPDCRHPDPVRLAAAAGAPRANTVDSLLLDRQGGRARKMAPLSLDLSGIAKGFGVDEMARVLERFQVDAWLIGIDGETRAKGTKPDGSSWAVAHERPDRHVRDAMGVIELADMAVATSGNYRRWRETDHGTISHTIHPGRDVPLVNGIASVSVIAPTCMSADAWATALLVSGIEMGLALARSAALDAIFVLENGTVESIF
jgi:thiamine biosynthesis lipoprotein